MIKKTDKPPAFPEGFGQNNYTKSGMTLRDYFAAKALVAFATASFEGDTPYKDVATWCYSMADAMLEEREV